MLHSASSCEKVGASGCSHRLSAGGAAARGYRPGAAANWMGQRPRAKSLANQGSGLAAAGDRGAQCAVHKGCCRPRLSFSVNDSDQDQQQQSSTFLIVESPRKGLGGISEPPAAIQPILSSVAQLARPDLSFVGAGLLSILRSHYARALTLHWDSVHERLTLDCLPVLAECGGGPLAHAV